MAWLIDLCLWPITRVERAQTVTPKRITIIASSPAGRAVRALCLRLLGRYDEALGHDKQLLSTYQWIYGPEHYWTMNLSNNITLDLRCVGRFGDALGYDERTLADREGAFGVTNLHTLSSEFDVVCDLRQRGEYDRALDLTREVVDLHAVCGELWGLFRLLVSMDLGMELRRVYPDGGELGESTLRRYGALVGDGHHAALVVVTNLLNDRRLTDDFADAHELGGGIVDCAGKAIDASVSDPVPGFSSPRVYHADLVRLIGQIVGRSSDPRFVAVRTLPRVPARQARSVAS